METQKIEALKDLLIRLEDARKGYLEIRNAISNRELRNWMEQYAYERKRFQDELKSCMIQLGGRPEEEISTSFLGELHHSFIAFKLNNFTDDLDSIIAEVERGSNQLITDYKKVIEEISYPLEIEAKLLLQKNLIIEEIESLKDLKEQLKIKEMTS